MSDCNTCKNRDSLLCDRCELYGYNYYKLDSSRAAMVQLKDGGRRAAGIDYQGATGTPPARSEKR